MILSFKIFINFKLILMLFGRIKQNNQTKQIVGALLSARYPANRVNFKVKYKVVIYSKLDNIQQFHTELSN